MEKVGCPAIFLTAPASGQGKTTITAALARLLKLQGKVVRVFKTGPDYLDPQILAQASGEPVVQLDMWMAGEEWCQNQLYEAAKVADLILVEGAMGMFDGEPSSADLAARFNIPVVIVMNVKGMAQTAAAIAAGLATFREDVTVEGIIANDCGSERHEQLIRDALPPVLPLLAALKRTDDMALPERHLGLVQAQEITQALEPRFNAGAKCLEEAGILNWVDNLRSVEFYPTLHSADSVAVNSLHGSGVVREAKNGLKNLLRGKTVAIAKDKAFSFIYDANVQLLKDMGACIEFFSPIHDSRLPDADALWLAGGYPELHAEALSSNTMMIEQIQLFHQQSKPILAECGGFLYCLETLTDLDNGTHNMLGLMQGRGAMRGKRGCQGMQTAPLPEGEVRAHAHHRSRSEGTPEPIAYGIRQRHPAPGEAVYRQGSLTASYLHLFFPSNPNAIADLFLGSMMHPHSLTTVKVQHHVS